MSHANDRAVEDALNQSVGTAERDVGEPPTDRFQGAVIRGRKLGRRRLGLNLVVAVAVAAAVILPLTSLLPLGGVNTGPAESATVPANSSTQTTSLAAPVHAGWLTYQLPAEGLSIQAPADWHLVEDPLPALVDPHALIELASYYAPLDPDSGCAPSKAIAGLPEDGVVLWLDEMGPHAATDQFPPKPDPFKLENLNPYECISQPAYLTPFSDQGRYFELFAVFGPHAPDSVRQAVIDSLGSLQADPGGGTGPGPGAAASWYSPPAFAPSSGWQTLSTSQDGSSLASDAVPQTWASNVPFAQADLASLTGVALTGEFWPQHTIDGLSGDGVVIVADLESIGLTPPTNGGFPVREAPLDIHDATGPVEGDRQFVLWAAVNHQYVAIRFFYGTDSPTDVQLSAAQQELNNLVVPSLPPGR
jgi:hypothetical protein